MSLLKAHSQVDATIHAVLRHRFQNHGVEPAPLRRRCRWSIALDPAHGRLSPSTHRHDQYPSRVLLISAGLD
jgi:hypothetical protein